MLDPQFSIQHRVGRVPSPGVPVKPMLNLQSSIQPLAFSLLLSAFCSLNFSFSLKLL